MRATAVGFMPADDAMPAAQSPSASQDGQLVLAIAGLSAAEEIAYELLIDRRTATLHHLDAIWTRPESLRDTLTALETKGLVTARPGDTVWYAAVAPNLALEGLLLSREHQLREVSRYATQLAATYQQRAAGRRAVDIVEVVTGRRAVRHRLIQVQRDAREEVCCLDKPPSLDRPGTRVTTLEVLQRGVARRTIYERASLEPSGSFPQIERLIKAGEQARIVATLPFELYLTDRRLAFLPLQREPAAVGSAIVIHPSGLLEALGELFEGLWQRALPLRLPNGDTRHTAAADHQADERLIALLLSGLTDQTIARQLGIGHRTVQRKVASLINTLGARTRFQAGVQAARNLRSEQRRHSTPLSPEPETSTMHSGR